MIVSNAFRGKRYAVLGLARSGMATVEALLASGAEVVAWDRREGPREELAGRATIADPLAIDLAGFDGVVLSPGVPLNTHPIADKARAAGVPLIGDIELFAQARPTLPAHKVVGITGTNGKSTTTALVHHILQTAGVPSAMGGNIGLPILAQDPLPEGGVYVLELSSYQLDLTQSLDCDVAVLLNITPDHLDRYESFEAYVASKARLFEMQSPDHFAFVGDTTDEAGEAVAKVRRNFYVINSESYLDNDGNTAMGLRGIHNAENVGIAANVCKELGVPDEAIWTAGESFRVLPHRMEQVRDRDGVVFVNDSKATNPTATAPALAAFERIRWICGGQAKTDSLDECAPFFDHVRKAYTIGEAGELFASLLSPHMNVAECETLERAVGEAAREAEAGDTVLLSPACASFDQFRDFEDRGDRFKELVGAL